MLKFFIVATTALTLVAQEASAAKCKDVIVIVANHAGEDMRVVQIKAYNSDDDRWRTISTANWITEPLTTLSQLGDSKEVNISGSRGERVAVRVKYKFVSGGDNTRYETDSRYKTCTNGTHYSVKIPRSGHRPD
jgi:hypothetical protein